MFEQLNEDLLFEMANLSHKRTGLPYDIWIDSSGVDRNTTHNEPRIKIKVDGKFIPFTIDEDPDIPESVKATGFVDFPHKNKIKEYVVAYRKVLLAHYYKKIDDADALQLLKTIRSAKESELVLNSMINTTEAVLHVEFYWDKVELLYVINLIADNSTVLKTIYAMDDSYLSHELDELKLTYDITKVINRDEVSQ